MVNPHRRKAVNASGFSTSFRFSQIYRIRQHQYSLMQYIQASIQTIA